MLRYAFAGKMADLATYERAGRFQGFMAAHVYEPIMSGNLRGSVDPLRAMELGKRGAGSLLFPAAFQNYSLYDGDIRARAATLGEEPVDVLEAVDSLVTWEFAEDSAYMKYGDGVVMRIKIDKDRRIEYVTFNSDFEDGASVEVLRSRGGLDAPSLRLLKLLHPSIIWHGVTVTDGRFVDEHDSYSEYHKKRADRFIAKLQSLLLKM